jgi:hypothetical protein
MTDEEFELLGEPRMTMAQFWIEEKLAEEEALQSVDNSSTMQGRRGEPMETTHKELIDGLESLVDRDLMKQRSADKIVKHYQDADLPDWLDEVVLQSIYKERGLTEDGKEPANE